MKNVFEVLDGKIKYSDIGKKKRGRKAGYKHSDKTRDKIAEKMRGRVKDEDTKEKISKSLLGREKPFETRRKISRSKTHNSVARDLLETYSGLCRERDIPNSTHDYISKCGEDPLEICTWIKEHFAEINDGQGEPHTRTVRWEADLNAEMKKEEPNLEDIGLLNDDWRS